MENDDDGTKEEKEACYLEQKGMFTAKVIVTEA